VSVDDDKLADLARSAGIAVDWIDAAKRDQTVSPGSLRGILQALGLPCSTRAEIDESRMGLNAAAAVSPPMITADAGSPISLAGSRASRAKLILEDGTQRDVMLESCGAGRVALPTIATPGYHKLHIAEKMVTLAIAPKTCVTIDSLARDSLAQGRRLWGLAVQLYGLHRPGDGGMGDGGMGDATALRLFAKSAAQHGADVIALSPTHALFSAEPGKFSPYSPSSRLAFNPLICDPAILFGADRIAAIKRELGFAGDDDLPTDSLIDWPTAAPRKFALLRALFDTFWTDLHERPDDPRCRDFLKFRRDAGIAVESHALFEALSAERAHIDPLRSGWRDWPADLRDPASPAVAAFASAHAKDIAFHAFLQWLAQNSLAAAQAVAVASGMRVGLIADLAVGMESGGSHAWSRQSDVLVGLTIGAPPDLFNSKGQNWGLTTFSPRSLIAEAFAPFLTTLRTALGQAGGVRIDHAMGLARLWLIPEAAAASEGAYLAYPLDDLLRLIKLESLRHRAVVIAEDLGTVPADFRAKLTGAGIAGLDVLWFGRDGEGFLPPRKWRPDAVAMTSTHDLPTVAGWWKGADIDMRAQCDLLDPAESVAELKQQRGKDRTALWDAFRASGSVPEKTPSPEDASTAVDAAIRFVAETPAPLVLLPLEDLLGVEEQPNLPGTIDEHPNWRRRYAPAAEDIFADSRVAARAQMLSRRSGA
jgi:4-alpha-glucanotransferase